MMSCTMTLSVMQFAGAVSCDVAMVPKAFGASQRLLGDLRKLAANKRAGHTPDTVLELTVVVHAPRSRCHAGSESSKMRSGITRIALNLRLTRNVSVRPSLETAVSSMRASFLIDLKCLGCENFATVAIALYETSKMQQPEPLTTKFEATAAMVGSIANASEEEFRVRFYPKSAGSNFARGAGAVDQAFYQAAYRRLRQPHAKMHFKTLIMKNLALPVDARLGLVMSYLDISIENVKAADVAKASAVCILCEILKRTLSDKTQSGVRFYDFYAQVLRKRISKRAGRDTVLAADLTALVFAKFCGGERKWNCFRWSLLPVLIGAANSVLSHELARRTPETALIKNRSDEEFDPQANIEAPEPSAADMQRHENYLMAFLKWVGQEKGVTSVEYRSLTLMLGADIGEPGNLDQAGKAKVQSELDEYNRAMSLETNSLPNQWIASKLGINVKDVEAAKKRMERLGLNFKLQNPHIDDPYWLIATSDDLLGAQGQK